MECKGECGYGKKGNGEKHGCGRADPDPEVQIRQSPGRRGRPRICRPAAGGRVRARRLHRGRDRCGSAQDRRAQQGQILHRGYPLLACRVASSQERSQSHDRFLPGRDSGRALDLRSHPAAQDGRPGPFVHRQCDRRDRQVSPSRDGHRSGIHDLPGHHPRNPAAEDRSARAEGGQGYLPGVFARAGGSRTGRIGRRSTLRR